jgi:hypothetical protein
VAPRRSWFVRKPWRAALAAVLVFAALVGAVATAEYVSELQKIDRGTFTDTFDPVADTQLVTLPASAAPFVTAPTYPDEFSVPEYREVVRQRSAAFLAAGAAQAVVVYALLVGGLLVWRTRRPLTVSLSPPEDARSST